MKVGPGATMRQLATVIVFAGVSCGSGASSPDIGVTSLAAVKSPEAQRCEAEARPVVASYSQTLMLVAALPTTAAAATHWEMTKNGPNGPRPVVSRWSGLPADRGVLFCYFDGDFANFVPPGPPGVRPMSYERALVFVTDGQGPWLDHVGPKATNPLTAP